MESEVTKILDKYGYSKEELDQTVNVGEAGSNETYDRSHYEELLMVLRKDELKNELRIQNLPLQGNKIDLVQI